MSQADEALAAALEAFDRRLSSIDKRFVDVEHHMAEAASAGEEGAKQAAKLADLFLSLDRRIEELAAVMSNYVEATRELRETSRNLHSEVRQKLKAIGG